MRGGTARELLKEVYNRDSKAGLLGRDTQEHMRSELVGLIVVTQCARITYLWHFEAAPNVDALALQLQQQVLQSR